jgi:hypothetical protein
MQNDPVLDTPEERIQYVLDLLKHANEDLARAAEFAEKWHLKKLVDQYGTLETEEMFSFLARHSIEPLLDDLDRVLPRPATEEGP